jgi:hypothetical protein
MTQYTLAKSRNTINPFKKGDKVVCVDNGGGYGTDLPKDREYTVLDTGDIYVTVDGPYRKVDCLHARFKFAQATEEVIDSVADLVRKHAASLDAEIAAGTMVPGLSSLGFLVNFLLDYKRLDA